MFIINESILLKYFVRKILKAQETRVSLVSVELDNRRTNSVYHENEGKRMQLRVMSKET